MACPENSTFGICEIMSEAGTGIGEFATGLMANNGLVKLLFVLGLLGAIIGLVVAVTTVIKKSVGNTGKRM